MIMTEEDKSKISTVKITNFPPDITENDAVGFLNEKVDGAIKKENISINRSERSSQITLGPGPSTSVIIRAAETLDHYQYSPDRILYTRPIRPLTPVKQPKSSKEVPAVNNTVKDVIKDLESKDAKKETKNDPPKHATSQAKLSSAGTFQIIKHKQGLGVEKQLKR